MIGCLQSKCDKILELDIIPISQNPKLKATKTIIQIESIVNVEETIIYPWPPDISKNPVNRSALKVILKLSNGANKTIFVDTKHYDSILEQMKCNTN